jgi:hypothetical protein
MEKQFSHSESLHTPEQKEPTSNESRIAKVTSFDELYFVLEKLAVIPGQTHIQGKRKDWSFSELKLIIERVRHGHRPETRITRTFGLREKVEELLLTDKVYAKYVTKKEGK